MRRALKIQSINTHARLSELFNPGFNSRGRKKNIQKMSRKINNKIKGVKK